VGSHGCPAEDDPQEWVEVGSLPPVKALLQRVRQASVTVEDRTVGAIGPGLLVLLGVGRGDGETEAVALADRIAGLRIFQDPEGKMNLSLLDTHRAALVVSQFTLYADTRKGRRPSFIDAAPPDEARRLYARSCEALRALGVRVEEGVFAAEMQVALVNDGPVTILLEQSPQAPTR
jgi:D-aminoacyl-tRNA deacylase